MLLESQSKAQKTRTLA